MQKCIANCDAIPGKLFPEHVIYADSNPMHLFSKIMPWLIYIGSTNQVECMMCLRVFFLDFLCWNSWSRISNCYCTWRKMTSSIDSNSLKYGCRNFNTDFLFRPRKSRKKARETHHTVNLVNGTNIKAVHNRVMRYSSTLPGLQANTWRPFFFVDVAGSTPWSG